MEVFANAAESTLAAGITDVATALTLATGEGARFPEASATAPARQFRAVLVDGVGDVLEYLLVTARAGDALTVVREAEDAARFPKAARDAGTRVVHVVTATALTLLAAAAFGDGSDGVGTFDGTATPAGTSKSGSAYTATRDLYYTDAVLSASSTLNMAGYRLYVRGTLTVGAGCVLQRPANNASGVNAGAALGDGTTGGGGAGGAGGNGANGTASNQTSTAYGGGGGNSGNATGAGGVGGGRTAGGIFTLAAAGSPRSFDKALALHSPATAALYKGGNGGSGGDAATLSVGGGGGGGGGVVAVYARKIVNEGAIRAHGGSGAAASGSGTGAGGGGGGGGGAIILVFAAYTGSGTVTATGGTGGAPQGLGNNGAAGSNGNVFWVPLT